MQPVRPYNSKINSVKVSFSAIHTVWTLWSCIYHEFKDTLIWGKIAQTSISKPFRIISVFIRALFRPLDWRTGLLLRCFSLHFFSKTTSVIAIRCICACASYTDHRVKLIGTLRYENVDVIKDAVAAWGLCRRRRVCGGKNKLRWRDSATRPLIDRKEK